MLWLAKYRDSIVPQTAVLEKQITSAAAKYNIFYSKVKSQISLIILTALLHADLINVSYLRACVFIRS